MNIVSTLMNERFLTTNECAKAFVQLNYNLVPDFEADRKRLNLLIAWKR
jgi:hypothetical protein